MHIWFWGTSSLAGETVTHQRVTWYFYALGSAMRGGEGLGHEGKPGTPGAWDVTRKRQSRDGRVTGARRADPGEDALRREERRSPRGRPPGGTQQEGLG